jgi:colanic acid/amylovoran biosynthesis glycosyltransferase
MEPVVVHSFPVWLPQTQTWMYSQVDQLQKLGIKNYVVCDRTENLNQFAVKGIICLENASPIRQIWDKGARKLRLRPYSGLLNEQIKNVGANIVHSHFGNVGWNNLRIIRNSQTKHVVTFYGFDVSRLPKVRPVWIKRYFRLFAEVDRVLCEGSHMANCIVDLGCPSNKVRVQHLGVDVDNISFRPRVWNQENPLKVLIAASFREKKGIPNAISALSIINKETPIELTIIGDSGLDQESQNEKTRILQALKSGCLENQTRLLGYQTHEAMLAEAYNHHLFLQPSITAMNGDTEGGAPVTIIEMLATGMPVVATTHCDIPEVVGPALSSFLAPEKNIIALSECIRKMLRNTSNWNTIAQDSRRHIENNYNHVKQAQTLLNHYKEVVTET